ncbi:exopolysaccharide biosynthesis protein [Kushneria sp. AK178]
MSNGTTLRELLTSLDERHEGNDVSINDILTTFESRGFGPLLVIPAFLALVCPVPGIPTACGLFMALIAVQQVFGRTHPWLPKRLRDVSVDADRFHRTVVRIKPWARRLEYLFKPRLVFMDSSMAQRLIAVLVTLISLSMGPLELLPFAAALPSGVLLLIALGMTARDGLVILLSLLIAIAGSLWLGLAL